MAIPDFQNVMRPVLASVQDGAPLPLNELRERVAGGERQAGVRGEAARQRLFR